MGLATALLRSQLGDRAGEALAALGASAGSAPEVPHFACVYVAVLPAARGRGVGESLMRRTLEACDTDGFGAHLVSTNKRNLSFYRRLGFELTGELPVAGGAVTFRPMWRESST
jgi:ribosomal protein S18 acetylase RimI-like enzyme